ncbi:MAG: hypothetical protein H6619_06800 [Deltaproteobacteria bacterium]|nr:hypothetical protein [Deltaproteobacteria bacterium]
MSVVPSARSFIIPFLDKRNMITIILIAVFFAIYRMSGGALETGRDGVSTRTQDRGSFFADSSEEERERAQLRDQESSRSDFYNRMLETDTQQETERTQGSSASRLDDIEKSLGLR